MVKTRKYKTNFKSLFSSPVIVVSLDTKSDKSHNAPKENIVIDHVFDLKLPSVHVCSSMENNVTSA